MGARKRKLAKLLRFPLPQSSRKSVRACQLEGISGELRPRTTKRYSPLPRTDCLPRAPQLGIPARSDPRSTPLHQPNRLAVAGRFEVTLVAVPPSRARKTHSACAEAAFRMRTHSLRLLLTKLIQNGGVTLLNAGLDIRGSFVGANPSDTQSAINLGPIAGPAGRAFYSSIAGAHNFSCGGG